MRRYLLSLACLLIPSAALAAPRVGDEYIVLHTSAGDVVLALYPDVAPQHVQQLLKLARLGVFDGTHFGRVEADFVVQLSAVHEREFPLTPEQKAAVHPLKAEFSNLEHRRGILSMARADGQPDSAETSFSVMVGTRDKCKHLDGNYTIFGHVEAGMEVFDKMIAVPRMLPPDPPAPIVPIELFKAEVVTADKVHSIPLEMAHDITIPAKNLAEYRNKLQRFFDTMPKQPTVTQQEKEQARTGTVYLVSGCALVIVGLSLASFFLSSRLSTRWLGGFILLSALIASFMVFVLLAPAGGEHQSIAAGIFFGMAGIFKLMSRFESA